MAEACMRITTSFGPGRGSGFSRTITCRSPIMRRARTFPPPFSAGPCPSAGLAAGLRTVGDDVDLVRPDPVPIDLYAEARPLQDGDVTGGIDRVEVIRIVAVDRGFSRLQQGMDQAHFVIVTVAKRSKAVAVGWARGVDRHVQSESLGGMGNLHQAGDPAVISGIRMDVVSRLGNDEVDVRLERSDVLPKTEGRLDKLAELAVGEGGDTAVFERVLVPEEVRLIAGPTDTQGIGERVQLAGGVDHEVHRRPNLLPHLQDGRDLALDRPISPAVNLEGRIPHLATTHREVSVRFWTAEAAVLE